ncbi:peroxiredoxin [Nitrobacteraceae bacterium AZCC 1564]
MSRRPKSTATTSRGGAQASLLDAATGSATEYLIASCQTERALKAGEHAPSFRLPDEAGVEVSSEALLSRGPMLLMFFCGSWCVPCNSDLRALERVRKTVEVRGATVVGISQQTVEENLKTRHRLKLGFSILSDRGGLVCSQFGVRWQIPELLRGLYRKSGVDLALLNGEGSWTLPISATFVVDRAGLIICAEVNPGQVGRSNPRDILPVIGYLCGSHAV